MEKKKSEIRLTIRINKKEEEVLKKYASKNNVSVNDYIKRRLFGDGDTDGYEALSEYEKKLLILNIRNFQFTTLLCEKLLKKEDCLQRKKIVEELLKKRKLV